MAPSFLTLEEVLALHADQVRRYGGAQGVRDLGGLESALGVPQASYEGQWLHASVPEMAAAYHFHIVMNHPFVDGNRRAGLAAAIAFLGVNDLRLDAPEDDVVDLVLGIASGRVTKSAVAVFLAEHTEPW